VAWGQAIRPSVPAAGPTFTPLRASARVLHATVAGLAKDYPYDRVENPHRRLPVSISASRCRAIQQPKQKAQSQRQQACSQLPGPDGTPGQLVGGCLVSLYAEALRCEAARPARDVTAPAPVVQLIRLGPPVQRLLQAE